MRLEAGPMVCAAFTESNGFPRLIGIYESEELARDRVRAHIEMGKMPADADVEYLCEVVWRRAG
jgi:hypothetical protein